MCREAKRVRNGAPARNSSARQGRRVPTQGGAADTVADRKRKPVLKPRLVRALRGTRTRGSRGSLGGSRLGLSRPPFAKRTPAADSPVALQDPGLQDLDRRVVAGLEARGDPAGPTEAVAGRLGKRQVEGVLPGFRQLDGESHRPAR